MKENILGYLVDGLDLNQCTDEIIECVTGTHNAKWLACLNPHSYVVAQKDTDFSQALHSADWLIPDGIGIVYASKILCGSIKDRVTGPDIFFALHDKVNKISGLRVFFLGGAESTLFLIKDKMAEDYPDIVVAGTYSPPFRDSFSSADLQHMISIINSANVDILWVGLSAPKQEKWIYHNINQLDVKFIGAVGAVFDFYAGTVQRSPLIFRKMGLEWLPRLLQQPLRLWRRMFVSAPIFVWHVLKARVAKHV